MITKFKMFENNTRSYWLSPTDKLLKSVKEVTQDSECIKKVENILSQPDYFGENKYIFLILIMVLSGCLIGMKYQKIFIIVRDLIIWVH